jgi:tetratricopeptide (TPR) repeat protein
MKRAISRMVIFIPLILSATGGVLRDPLHDATREGRELYDRGEYPRSLEAFGSGRAEDPNHPVLAFNVGDALLAMGKVSEAQAEFRKALATADLRLKARTHYNLGNALAVQENWQAAAESYRESLLLDPSQKDAKRNLELALRKIKEKKEKRQQNQSRTQQEQKQDQGNRSDSQSPEDRGSGRDTGRPQQSPSETGDQRQSASQKEKSGRDGKESPPAADGATDSSPRSGTDAGQRPTGKMAGSNSTEGKVRTMDKTQALQLLQALEKQEQKELFRLQQGQKRKRPAKERDW